MISAFVKAIEQLPDSRFRNVVLIGILGAVGTLIVLFAGAKWALNQVPWTELWLIGPVFEWMGGYADEVGLVSFIIGAGGLTWMLFPVAAVAVISLFLDSICEAVEQRHYPHRANPRSQPLLEAIFGAIKFLAITIALNLAALPVYLLLIWFLGTGAFLFLIVNGYLVSREFFEMVAARRMAPGPAKRLRRAHRLRLILFGMLSVFLMSVPLVNLVAPVLAAAAMVHFYEKLPRRDEFEAMEDPSAGRG